MQVSVRKGSWTKNAATGGKLGRIITYEKVKGRKQRGMTKKREKDKSEDKGEGKNNADMGTNDDEE